MGEKLDFRLAFLTTLLAFMVTVLGAYTRLTDAGLGCPDWPGCYGKIWVPKSSDSPFEKIHPKKAWTEMVHRYVAGILGLLIFVLGYRAIKQRGLMNHSLVLPIFLCVMVIFQALLGMWTVTLKLYPLVVVAHLLGGLTTLSLLWLLFLKLSDVTTSLRGEATTSLRGEAEAIQQIPHLNTLRFWASFALIVLIIQLFLGGWTSANYAALVCIDFPYCQGQWLPDMHFSNAFHLTQAGIGQSMGEPLDNASRITIHMAHRLGALFTAIVIGFLLFHIFRETRRTLFRNLARLIGLLLIAQIFLGIVNIIGLLPLFVAVLHNAVAALLLLALVTLNYYAYSITRFVHRL